MNYEIESYAGVGPIRFGMSRDEVRKVVIGLVEEAARTSSGLPTDFFKDVGIFVYYKEPGITEAVEFGGPCSPTFRGQHFLGRQYAEMEQWIKTFDPEVVLKDTGLTSRKFGFGLYAESARKRPELPVEGVIVFEKGYYDSGNG
jgi:hypothetical protein